MDSRMFLGFSGKTQDGSWANLFTGLNVRLTGYVRRLWG